MKVTAILKGRIDSNGHQPIQIRINHEGVRYFKPTHIKITPALFEKGRVKNAHPKALEHNKTIERLIIQYQAQALAGFEKKVQKINLYTFIATTIQHLTRKDSTVRQYQAQVSKLKAFRPAVNVDELNHTFFNGYKKHLQKIGNDENTIWSAFKFLKTFVKKAMNDGHLKSDPFLNWEFPKYTDPQKSFLTEKEVKQIDKFCQDKKCPKMLEEAGAWFLIGCYTGLRISDIKAFDKKKNIVNNRLVFHTQKTGEIVGLPISSRLKKYFEKVDFRPLSMHENTYNQLIKVIAASAGITKHISSHTARHTAAMMLANAGVSIEVTAKILGHASTKTTNIYYKITNKRIDSELKKLK